MLKKDLIELLQKGLSYKEIGEIYGLHKNTISYWAKKFDVSHLNKHQINNHFREFKNENLFKEIKTEEQAYWLGFLYADGTIAGTSNRIKLTLSEKDKDHLEKFKNFIKLENKLIYNEKQKSVTYQFRSTKMKNDLINLGCVPNKTFILKFPNEKQVPKFLISHFIRGYFDGDGSVYKTNRSFGMNIIGTEDILVNIMKESKLPKKNTYPVHNNQIVRRIQLEKKDDLKILINYLYLNSSIKLERKFNTAQKLLLYLK